MEKNPRAEMMDFEKIGGRLRDLRKQKGITQQQIADVMDIGRNQYQKYEKGITLVPSDKVDMLVKYYDVTADYILYGDESYKFLKLLDSLSPMQKRKILPAIESMILEVST